jgi:hypothetical protein
MMMSLKKQSIFICLLSLFFWMVFCPSVRAGSVVYGPLDVPADVFWANIKTAQNLADFFDKKSNPNTGLSLSFVGDNRPIALYGAQIYDIGLRLMADSPLSKKIIETFIKNSSSRASRNSPQTVERKGRIENEGIFCWIRIEGFDQPKWWQSWEWSIKTGENAWLGKGALHYYRQTRDPRALQMAKERAEFILKLQDKDGGVRVGPELPNNALWWRVKSTENNESALNFFDEIYLTTHDPRYKAAADRIYHWLMATMYDRQQHLFFQGQVFKDGRWIASRKQEFATDTTSWAPLNRMLEDQSFGGSRLERLAEMERMLAATVASTGVMQNDVLKGMSYSPLSRKDMVISIEWSAQFALRYLLVSVEYQAEGNLDKAVFYYRKYMGLISQLQGYLKNRDGQLTAAYAVYPDGRIAAGEPMWDQWTRTPAAYASVASHLYLGFALRRFDPLLDRNI